jgi:hypothetical protein
VVDEDVREMYRGKMDRVRVQEDVQQEEKQQGREWRRKGLGLGSKVGFIEKGRSGGRLMKLWAMGGDGMVRTGVTTATRKKTKKTLLS